jgi:hypothetical protein
VGPAYTEYHFRRKEHAPELTLSIDGNVLFSGHIHCYNTTLHYATIRSFEPGPGKSVGILVRDQWLREKTGIAYSLME